MTRHATYITVIAAACAALVSCFQPSFGEGGFLCQPGTDELCPEGYQCCASGVCRSDCSATPDQGPAADKSPAVDARPDVGPKPDAKVPSCTDVKRVGAKLLGGPATSDLVLTSQDVPVVGYVEATRYPIVKRKTARTGDKWSGPVWYKGRASMLDIALGKGDKLVALFSVKPSGGTGDGALYFSDVATVWKAPVQLGEKDKRLWPGSAVLAGAASEADVFYLATAMTGPPTDPKPGVVFGRITPGAGPHKELCRLESKASTKGLYRHGRLAAARGSAKTHTALSYYADGSKKWGVAAQDDAATKCSYKVFPGSGAAVDGPLTLGVDAGGKVYLVHPKAGAKALASLQLSTMDSAGATSAPKAITPAVNVDPASVSLAFNAAGRPCVSYARAAKAGSKTLEVHVACQDKSGAFLETKTAVASFTWDPAAAAYIGYPTSLALDSKGDAHMIYQSPTAAGVSLQYTRCPSAIVP